MWQTIAIILIGVAVVFYLGRKIYRLLTLPESVNPCAGCAGCALKEMKEIKGMKNREYKPDCHHASEIDKQ